MVSPVQETEFPIALLAVTRLGISLPVPGLEIHTSTSVSAEDSFTFLLLLLLLFLFLLLLIFQFFFLLFFLRHRHHLFSEAGRGIPPLLQAFVSRRDRSSSSSSHIILVSVHPFSPPPPRSRRPLRNSSRMLRRNFRKIGSIGQGRKSMRRRQRKR